MGVSRSPSEAPLSHDSVRCDTFDAATATWTLRSYAAVSGALASSALTAGHEPPATTIRNTIRAAAREIFPASRLAAWRNQLASSATDLFASLPTATPIDLMEAFARPWSFDLAMTALRLPRSFAETSDLFGLASTIFRDAALSATGQPSAATLSAATALAIALANNSTERVIDVQSFVALSQTLPHFISAAWHALLTQPDQVYVWRTLDDKSTAVDELLRFAGPSRAVFRTARASVQLGEATILTGQHVVLMLADANRDARVFPDPDRLELRRDASRHLAFGAGPHVCVGGPIVCVALEVATNALASWITDSTTSSSVEWLDGFAIRAPSSLLVTL
ncbi:MAG TPA: cytochrome P450 [Gemmatimonadaceae bacterium]